VVSRRGCINQRGYGLTPAARHYPQKAKDRPGDSEGNRIFFEGRHYEVSLTPLPGFANAGKGRLVTVDDIATSLTEINAAFPQYLLIGALGLILSEALLLALLSPPTPHLRHTALALPLLAHSASEAARSAVRGNADKKWMTDEIHAFSYRLKVLQAEVED
jgi:hypothetical protein